MPYMIQRRTGKDGADEFAVHKRGADGRPEGKAIGTHKDEIKAGKQIEAIVASEEAREKAVSAFGDLDFRPPAAVQDAAARGLEWAEQFKRGGTDAGLVRAADFKAGRAVSPQTIRRMMSYFEKHNNDAKEGGWSEGETGFPSAKRIAYDLWGGEAGYAWAARLAEDMNAREPYKTIKTFSAGNAGSLGFGVGADEKTGKSDTATAKYRVGDKVWVRSLDVVGKVATVARQKGGGMTYKIALVRPKGIVICDSGDLVRIGGSVKGHGQVYQDILDFLYRLINGGYNPRVHELNESIDRLQDVVRGEDLDARQRVPIWKAKYSLQKAARAQQEFASNNDESPNAEVTVVGWLIEAYDSVKEALKASQNETPTKAVSSRTYVSDFAPAVLASSLPKFSEDSVLASATRLGLGAEPEAKAEDAAPVYQVAMEAIRAQIRGRASKSAPSMEDGFDLLRAVVQTEAEQAEPGLSEKLTSRLVEFEESAYSDKQTEGYTEQATEKADALEAALREALNVQESVSESD